MSVTARTWVTGELNTAAKMNTIRDDILDLDSRMATAQELTVTIDGDNTEFTDVTITAVDTAHAYPLFSGASARRTDVADFSEVTIRGAELTSTTNLRVYHDDPGTGTYTTVIQVVEDQ